MGAAGCQPGCEHRRVGLQDDHQVWAWGVAVELPDEIEIDPVAALQDQRGRHVAIGDDDLAGRQVRADLGLQVVVAVGGDQAGQHQSLVTLRGVAGKVAKRGARRLGGGVGRDATTGELDCELAGQGGLADPAWPVDADQQPATHG